GRQYEHNQRSPVSGRCVHATDSTDEPVRRRRTRIKEFDVVEENPLAIGSEIRSCRDAHTCDFSAATLASPAESSPCAQCRAVQLLRLNRLREFFCTNHRPAAALLAPATARFALER